MGFVGLDFQTFDYFGSGVVILEGLIELSTSSAAQNFLILLFFNFLRRYFVLYALR